MLPRQVQLHVSKAVDVETTRADSPVVEFGLWQLEPLQRSRLDRGAELLDWHPTGKIGRCGREHVATMEGRRDRLERVLAVRDLVCGLDLAELLGRRNKEAVVGADVEPAVGAAQGERAPLAADSGVDNGEVNSFREVGKRVREHERTLQDALWLDPVRDVDDLDVWRDSLHDRVTRADEVVCEAEVGQEGDEHVSVTLID